MKRFSILLVISIVLHCCTAPPVTKTKNSDAETNENEINDKETGLEDYMEYHRYLKEVVDALESDPQFREKLEKAEEADIRSGKIAHELEFVNHKVRTKLDEIKRSELERLRHLANRQYELENGLNYSQEKVGIGPNDKEHLDHANPHTFEIEDLKKLISKSTQDLAEADQKRREEFKEYEMQKEFEKQEKLKTMDDAHRIELENELQKQAELHKKHDPLHHPGSKQQLEEVWEKQDHMDQQDFNPKTFFMLHDLDGNGVWDQNEVKTLFIKELDKMYNEGAPEDDMRERIEEMERMREHVFNEVDQNKDGLISYDEFIDQTRKQEFNEDKGWDTLDNQKVYTDEEYKHFEKQRMEEVERLIAQGMLPPHPGAPVYHDPRMQGHNQFPPQGQYHPGQVPPQGQYHPGQVSPQAQYHPAQGQIPPQAQFHHPNQVPLGHPQGQMHPGQVSQQAQFHPGQVPQAQVNPQQLPNPQVAVKPPTLQRQPDLQLNTNEILPNKPQAVPQAVPQGQRYQPPPQVKPQHAQHVQPGQIQQQAQVQQKINQIPQQPLLKEEKHNVQGSPQVNQV